MKCVCQSYNLNNNNSVSFCGYTSRLGKKFDEVLKKGCITDADSNYIVSELNKILTKKSSKKKIGEGCTNTVYRIDDKYVFRAPSERETICDEPVTIVNQEFKKLKSYYGEPVITIGKFSVLKNASGKNKQITAGVPKVSYDGTQPLTDIQYYNSVIMPTFADIPQKSYDSFAKELSVLNSLAKPENNIYYRYDYHNPNNVILSGKTLKMIDDLYVSDQPRENTISDMINLFLKQIKVNYPAVPNTSILPLRQAIAEKIITAGFKYNLPLGNSDKANSGWSFIFKYLCNAKEEPQKIFDTLNEISKISDKSARERELEKYLETIFQL